MPNCVQCGTAIKEKASYCPTCGCRNPLEKKSKTDDFTLTFNSLGEEYPKYIPKEKQIAAMLAIMVGFLGLQYRYLENKKMTFLISIISGIVFLITALVVYFVGPKDISISVALGIFGMYLYNIGDGMTMLLFKRRDGHGELLR